MSCICTREYAPVCVKEANGNWQQYSNFCGARCSHTELQGMSKEDAIAKLKETGFLSSECPEQPALLAGGSGAPSAAELLEEDAAFGGTEPVLQFDTGALLAEAEEVAGADDPWDVSLASGDEVPFANCDQF